MLLPINGSPGGGVQKEESGNNGLDLELEEINFHCDPLENLSPNQRYVNLKGVQGSG